MYFHYDWVKQYLTDAPSLEEAARLLNSTGLETEIVGEGLEVEHTVNRPDAMCHFGIARELAVKAGLQLEPPPYYTGHLKPLEGWTIKSRDLSECNRYIALLVEGVTAGPSPRWLRERLEAIDQTSHNVLVDLTNFVLWETSHPTHAFDADKLSGNLILVRMGQEGERLKTLDGRDHAVEGLLCITDTKGPVALGGVMGGENTEVDADTCRLLLEHANFRGATTRRTGKAVNIHSDARHRYERGIDLENMERVVRRFLYLLLQEQPQIRIVGMTDLNPTPFSRTVVHVRRSQLDRLLGIRLEDGEVVDLLTRMDFQPEVTATGWQVRTPGYKVDVTREADVIEELIRFAGLDRLQATLPAFGGSDYKPDPLLVHADKARNRLVALGLQEAINFDFCSDAADRMTAGPGDQVTLRNPMSRNQAVMRRSLLPGLLETTRYNQTRGQMNLGMFEIGHTFHGDHEPFHLGVVLSTGKDQQHWWGDTNVHPFYRVKGVYEALASCLDFSGLSLRHEVPDWLTSGEALGIWAGDVCLGGLGMLSDHLVARFELVQAPAVMAFDISFLHQPGGAALKDGALSNHPGMKIDLAFVLDQAHAYAAVRAHILAMNLPHLESLGLFDVYEGKALDKGLKSLGFRFRFRAADRTLTGEEVAACMERVKDEVCTRFGATIRM